VAPTTPVATNKLKDLFITKPFEEIKIDPKDQKERESSADISEKSSGKLSIISNRLDNILELINSQIYSIQSYKMAPKLRPRGYNGRSRQSQSPNNPRRGISTLSVYSDSEISIHNNEQNTDSNVPQNIIPSTNQGKIPQTLSQIEGQQTLAQRCAQQKQLQSHKSPSQILPGGFPSHGESSRQGESLRENQRLGSNESYCESLLSQSGESSTPQRPSTSQFQHDQSPLQTSQKYSKKQSLEKLHLRGDDQDGQISPRDLSTSGERENSEATSHATGPPRLLISPSSNGSHVSLPDFPNPINPANEAFHHAFEVNMKHMEDFTKACAYAVKKKLNSCLSDFAEISKSHKEFLDKQYSTLNLMRTGVPTIAENLSQVCEFLPKMEANISTQQSRFMTRIENNLEENSSQMENILNKMERLSQNIIDLDENTKNKLESQYNTFQDLSNRVDLNLEKILQRQTETERLVRILVTKVGQIHAINTSERTGSPTSSIRELPPHTLNSKDNVIETDTVQQNAPHISNNKNLPCKLTSHTEVTPHSNQEEQIAKLILSNLPKSSEWPTFSGEGEYDHYEFIEWIDNLKEDTNAPDELICSKLPTILKGVAHTWYTNRRKEVVNRKQWDFWKNEIINKFSTHTWLRKVKSAFRRDRFDVQGDVEPSVWCTRQVKRLRATDRDIDNFTINDKLLSQLDQKTEYKMKIAMDPEDDLSEFITQLEHIVNVKRKRNKVIKKDNYKEKKTEKHDTEKEKELTCYLCGKKGHKSNKCTSKDKQKSKKIAIMCHEDNQKEISDNSSSSEDSLPESEEDEEEESTSSGYSTNAIIYSEEKVISNIQHLKDKQKPKSIKVLPVKKPDYTGKMHKSGGTNITNIVCNKFKLKCLIDGGAYCSIISPRLLDKILPDWKNQLLVMKPEKFYSCNSRLNPLGIIKLDIIFPHTTTSVQIPVELVVMEDFKLKYIILGNDYCQPLCY